MEISSKFVGAKLRELSMEISFRETMNYAAGIGDNNPAYFDDTRPEGIVAPPMFAAALTWRVSGRIWEFIEAPDFPTEALMTQVHYSEHVEFHRPVVPGDRLTLAGSVAAIMPHRAGTHVVVRYDATDKKGGPVFTAHTGAMLRGVKCADDGDGGDSLPVVPAPGDIADERPVWNAPVHIDPLAAHVYDGCSDIFFPIHTSPRFAKSVGLPGIILQGTATLAIAAREIVNRDAGGDPRRLKKLRARFSGMTRPGGEINVELNCKSGNGSELFYTVKNESGEKVLSGGYAEILP